MAIDKIMWIEKDPEFDMLFFYCQLCPLTIPFLSMANAYSYREGHKHNTYHKRRLELRQ